ncbi:MAG: hypothetical protein AAGK74_00645 [Chloroflexota bacterium]
MNNDITATTTRQHDQVVTSVLYVTGGMFFFTVRGKLDGNAFEQMKTDFRLEAGAFSLAGHENVLCIWELTDVDNIRYRFVDLLMICDMLQKLNHQQVIVLLPDDEDLLRAIRVFCLDIKAMASGSVYFWFMQSHGDAFAFIAHLANYPDPEYGS